MFTIDLLKGQGRPIRTRPKGIAIFVATFVVPVLVAILMASYYYNNKVVISINKQNIANYTTQIGRLADTLKLKESWDRDKTNLSNCLSDVANSVKTHTQWSPILVSLVQNLPDSAILNSLEVRQTSIKKAAAGGSAIAEKDNKDKTGDVSITVRTLKMRLCGNPNSDFDREIKAFRDRLLASNVIGTKLEDVVIASQTNGNMDGRDVVSYDIDCIFKPGI
ncbi:MAG: hypothetical protein ABSB11_03890 [Sedimentisphaerales bacterium]|jgi:hypothetical protein